MVRGLSPVFAGVCLWACHAHDGFYEASLHRVETPCLDPFGRTGSVEFALQVEHSRDGALLVAVRGATFLGEDRPGGFSFQWHEDWRVEENDCETVTHAYTAAFDADWTRDQGFEGTVEVRDERVVADCLGDQQRTTYAEAWEFIGYFSRTTPGPTNGSLWDYVGPGYCPMFD